MAKIQVGGELTSIESSHKLVDAAQVKDSNRSDQTQADINTEFDTAISGKVDKETGKGLSSVDVTTTMTDAWDAKYDKPTTGIPAADMADAVQASLALADNAVQQEANKGLYPDEDAAKLTQVGADIGDISTLETTSDNIVDAINEVNEKAGGGSNFVSISKWNTNALTPLTLAVGEVGYDAPSNKLYIGKDNGTAIADLEEVTMKSTIMYYYKGNSYKYDAVDKKLVYVSGTVQGATVGDTSAFSATTAYSKGDLVEKDGTIYEAKEDVAAAAWDETKFSEYLLKDKIENLADEEDIDYNAEGKLQFKNKAYNALQKSGLGRYYVRKNDDVTSLADDNVMYIFQYDHDLEGATWNVPANSMLTFEGGSITNGTITGDYTRILNSTNASIFKGELTISGTWNVSYATSDWFDCAKDGYYISGIGKGETAETELTLTEGGACCMYNNTSQFFTGDANTKVYKADVTGKSIVHLYGNSKSVNYGISFYSSDTTFDATTKVASGVSANGKYDSVIDVPSGSKTICVPVSGTGEYYVKEVSYENIDDSHAWYVITKNDGTEEKLTYSTDPTGITATDDTAKLQSLIDLNAKHTVITEGVYMINAHRKTSGKKYGLVFCEKFDQILEINGILKHDLTHSTNGRYLLAVQSTKNCIISGCGELQGDMCEDANCKSNTEGYASGMLIASCVNLTVKGISAKYNSSDGIWARSKWGLTDSVKKQCRHRLENVTMSYNHRDGLVYEDGDNVIVENCYFEGNGTIKGCNDKAAVDVEPFRYNVGQGVYKRYCNGFVFRNNRFCNTHIGLKLERCFNAEVYGNYFQNGADADYTQWGYNRYPDFYGEAIRLVDCGLESWDKTDEKIVDKNRKWILSSVKVYDNRAENFNTFLNLYNGDRPNRCEAYGNVIINSAITYSGGTMLFHLSCCCDTRIHHNKMIYCNSILSYSAPSGTFVKKCYNIEIDNNYILLGNSEKGSANFAYPFTGVPTSMLSYYDNVDIHDNTIEAPNKNISVLGFGKFGRGSYDFQPLFVTSAVYNTGLRNTRYLGYNMFKSNVIKGDVNAIVNEDSWQMAVGNKFVSEKYKQEGTVAVDFKKVYFDKDFEANTAVEAGDWLKVMIGTTACAYLATNSGTLGDDSTIPTSVYTETFTSGDVFLRGVIRATGSNPNIRWKTVGICTSTTRPDSFNSVGRKLYETDQKRTVICTAVASDGTGTWKLVENKQVTLADGTTAIVETIGAEV